MFSKSCEYGIRAVLHMAQHSDEKRLIEITEISDAQNIPKHFLSKILQQLVHHKILHSKRGARGGFTLNKKPEDIKLIDVVESIDGLSRVNDCVFGLDKCIDEEPCPLHKQYKELREKILELLRSNNFKDLSDELSECSTVLGGVLKQE